MSKKKNVGLTSIQRDAGFDDAVQSRPGGLRPVGGLGWCVRCRSLRFPSSHLVSTCSVGDVTCTLLRNHADFKRGGLGVWKASHIVLVCKVKGWVSNRIQLASDRFPQSRFVPTGQRHDQAENRHGVFSTRNLFELVCSQSSKRLFLEWTWN